MNYGLFLFSTPSSQHDETDFRQRGRLEVSRICREFLIFSLCCCSSWERDATSNCLCGAFRNSWDNNPTDSTSNFNSLSRAAVRFCTEMAGRNVYWSEEVGSVLSLAQSRHGTFSMNVLERLMPTHIYFIATDRSSSEGSEALCFLFSHHQLVTQQQRFSLIVLLL